MLEGHVFSMMHAPLRSVILAPGPAFRAKPNTRTMEKCNRDNVSSGGGMQTRGTAERVRACISACPPAKASGKAK